MHDPVRVPATTLLVFLLLFAGCGVADSDGYSEDQRTTSSVDAPAATAPSTTVAVLSKTLEAPTTTKATTTTASTTATSTTVPRAPEVEGPPVEDLMVTLDDGNPFVLSEQFNPVILFFWATWCHSCHGLMPVIDGIAADYAGRLTVVAIARDSPVEDIESDVVEYLPSRETRWVFDSDMSISESFAIIGVPITVLVVGQSEAGRWLGLAEDGEIRDRLEEVLSLYET